MKFTQIPTCFNVQPYPPGSLPGGVGTGVPCWGWPALCCFAAKLYYKPARARTNPCTLPERIVAGLRPPTILTEASVYLCTALPARTLPTWDA